MIQPHVIELPRRNNQLVMSVGKERAISGANRPIIRDMGLSFFEGPPFFVVLKGNPTESHHSEWSPKKKDMPIRKDR